MKTADIMQLDCRIPENRETIQKVLRQIKPLAKCPDGQDIPMDKLERCFKVLCERYGYWSTLHPDTNANDKHIVWRLSLFKETERTSSGSNMWGISVYEVLSKAVILMYSKVRRKA